jgi:hypothetical protein
LNSQGQEKTTYRVEVSGWDARRIFFLETVALDWLPRGDKRVCLRHQPERGDLVFVRLLQPLETSRACPVPFLVERVEGPDESALYCVMLKPFQTPRSGGQEPVREPAEDHHAFAPRNTEARVFWNNAT